MSSKTADGIGASAAWRIALWPSVALALGSAVALSIMYLLVARDIRARTDAWLSGEAEVLADVSENTPKDALYDRLVQEVAELATREVPDVADDKNGHQASVFFLKISPGLDPIWVGPTPKSPFMQAVTVANLLAGSASNVNVEGWRKPFRVVYHSQKDGGGLYLGFADLAASTMLDHLMKRCLLVWGATVVLGFMITWIAAYRTLVRVERISETVSRIGTEDLSSRLPEGRYPDEISCLSRTFNRMLDRIQSSVRQMRILTDSVAHDLKSPVTAIRARLEVALSESDPDRWREHVAEAIDGLDRLSQLLNTSLDLAEANAGALRLRKEQIDLAKLIEQMVELYQPSMVERGHQLAAHLQPLLVRVDSSLLNRVLANLFDNEIAHLPFGCNVSIRLFEKNGTAWLTVEDDGPSFSPPAREQAFDRFVKGQHSSGHGLGLAFVQAVIQAHGGHVEIREREGGGAVIAMTLANGNAKSAKAGSISLA